MGRVLAIAGALGLVGLLAALRWRSHHLHTVDSVAQFVEGQGIASQVGDSHSPLFNTSLPVFILDECSKGDAPHPNHDTKYRRFIEHEDGSRSGTLQFDWRQLGRVAHQQISCGSLTQTDVPRPAPTAAEGAVTSGTL